MPKFIVGTHSDMGKKAAAAQPSPASSSATRKRKKEETPKEPARAPVNSGSNKGPSSIFIPASSSQSTQADKQDRGEQPKPKQRAVVPAGFWQDASGKLHKNDPPCPCYWMLRPWVMVHPRCQIETMLTC